MVNEIEIKREIDIFENKLLEALEFKYKGYPEEMRASCIEFSPVNRWDIKSFYDLYLSKGVYPQERIEKLIRCLFDIKIQMFYIVELDLGLYNRLIYDLGFGNNNISNCPYIALRWLSLDQNLIVKSRILWERIMNFIYYLETGEMLEPKRKKSKKSTFFDFIENTRWSYLNDYKNYIEWFDEKLRTPEVHKSSTLRRYFMQSSRLPSHKVEGFINIAMNAIWNNLLEIIQGYEPSSRYWDIAMREV